MGYPAINTETLHSASEQQVRTDLAAAFRLAARFNWHESVGNHFSVVISEDGPRFLMNPRWRHFALIKASDLMSFDGQNAQVLEQDDAPDPSAWAIHSHLHANSRHARCVLHLHPPYATALVSLADPTLLPIDQNTARFHGRIAVDLAYGGIADDSCEGVRIAEALGDRDILLMGNHGVLVVGPTIADAFEDLYFLELACRTLMLAFSTGRPLQVMPEGLAKHTARGWRNYQGMAGAHFRQLRELLDREDPSYAS